MLKAAHEAGRLQFFGPHAGLADKAAFKAFLEPLYDTKWHVYAKRPFAGPDRCLPTSPATRTASRSLTAAWSTPTRTASRSSTRIIGSKAPAGTRRMSSLAPGEFIRRFMLHVLPKGFHRIRHYGLLARSRTKAETLARARELIAAATAGTTWCNRRRISRLTIPRHGQRADPSLPVLRRTHGDHRAVRGRPHAASSADPGPGCDQDRHVMMMLATVLLVTADRLAAGSWPATMALGSIADPSSRRTRASAPLQDRGA